MQIQKRLTKIQLLIFFISLHIPLSSIGQSQYFLNIDLQANQSVNLDTIENSESFWSPFFQDHQPQPENNIDLHFEEGTKSYKMPTRYAETINGTALFWANLDSLQQQLPKGLYAVNFQSLKQNLKDSISISDPQTPSKGFALVAISFFGYGVVEDMDSYNEMAVSVAVSTSSEQKLKLSLPRLVNSLKFHVLSMPVTSLENQIRGQKIWNLPKVMGDIQILESEDYMSASLNIENEFAFSIRVPKQSRQPKTIEQELTLLSYIDGQLMESKSKGRATFSENINLLGFAIPSELPDLENSISYNSANELGAMIESLGLVGGAFQTRFTYNAESVFYPPQPTQ